MEQSHWQREAQHHEFDAYGRALDAGKRAVLEEAAAAAKAQQPQAAPVYYDVTYDPQHPDADWSGLVRKRSIKKPVAVSSALTPAPDGSGLTTAVTARTITPFTGKKHAAAAAAAAAPSSSSSPLLAGGSEPTGWKTTAQLLAEGAPTPKDAIVEEQRWLARARPPLRAPFQEPWPVVSPPPSSSSSSSGATAAAAVQGAADDLAGYRAPPSTWGGQRGASLLSGLGAKLRESTVTVTTHVSGPGGRDGSSSKET